MRIFVTGAAGFVGGHIIDSLLEEGHEVTALVRSEARGKKLADKGVSTVAGNVLKKESFESSLKGVDAVIHLVGIIVEERGGGTFEQVHFVGTKNVVDAARETGIKKYVHMSALGASQDSISQYHKTKYKAEEYVKNSGLDFTVFKPSVIHGEGDAFVNLYARMLRMSPFVPIIGDGKVKMQPVYVKDIAGLFKMAAEENRFSHKTYEVGGPEELKFDEIIDHIARAMNKTVYKIHMPIWFMRVNAAIMRLIYKKPPLGRDQLIMLEKDNVCDINRVKEDFLIDLVKFEDGLKHYLK